MNGFHLLHQVLNLSIKLVNVKVLEGFYTYTTLKRADYGVYELLYNPKTGLRFVANVVNCFLWGQRVLKHVTVWGENVPRIPSGSIK